MPRKICSFVCSFLQPYSLTSYLHISFYFPLHFLAKINSKIKYHIFTFKTFHCPFPHSQFCYTKTWCTDFSIYSETPFKIPWPSWKGYSESQRSRFSPAVQADLCFLFSFFYYFIINKITVFPCHISILGAKFSFLSSV